MVARSYPSSFSHQRLRKDLPAAPSGAAFSSLVRQTGADPVTPGGNEFRVRRVCRFALLTHVVDQAGVEPAIPEGDSFTDCCVCRFTTDP